MPTSNLVVPDGERPVTKKAQRIMEHFHQQEGICWICGFRMKPIHSVSEFSRVAATLDHLEERGSTQGRPRTTKAAHRMCNSARGHLSVPSQKHMDNVRRLFRNPAWIRMVFGKDADVGQGIVVVSQ